MFIGAAPTMINAKVRTGTGGKRTTLTPKEQAQADAFARKTGIEKAIPFIVAISGVLTIATLSLALIDRKKKPRGAKK